MKHISEYRDSVAAQNYARAINRLVTRPWTIMEICGGQTHAIVKFGVDELLNINLLHGPGCPVCVTPVAQINKAIAIASRRDVIFCSFGDMLRVPANRINQNGDAESCDLLSVKASGGDVRVVYSPMDALEIARNNPNKEIVFFAIGFETTAPANAMAVFQAHQQGIRNFSALVSHVLVPPAMEMILSSPDCKAQAFLAAGHVCTIMGYTEYEPIARKFHVPIVVTGFEPIDLLQGIYFCVKQLEEGRAEVENQYARSVNRDGNRQARQLMEEVFHVVPRQWRGLGEIPNSGLGLNMKYEAYDAEKRFGVADFCAQEPEECISGLILQGIRKPAECPAFDLRCTPERPLGATMVSSEGACAAYHQYRGGLA